jgi:hypothetical protein
MSVFFGVHKIARYIQTRTDAEDRIAILGSEPEIYFWTNPCRGSCDSGLVQVDFMRHRQHR